MKTTFWLLTLSLGLAISMAAQDKSSPPQSASVDAAPIEKSSRIELAERGDHHRTWQRVREMIDKDGKPFSVTNTAYVELETGMNVRQPDGTYVAASDEIEIVEDGAIARKGRHQVIFAVNCNSPVAIDMLTADGKRLQSRILGLAFFDTATGESVMIAEIKDSDGELVIDGKNEVIYYDAFTDLKADVRYRNSKAGLEQDIILREAPAFSPADYKLNPATTVLEVLTEFINPPVPEKKVQFTDGTVNELLDFGDLKMGNGRVYVLDQETTAIPVTKQWGTADGRTFLIEEIPYQIVEPELNILPPRTASLKTAPNGVLHQVSVKRLLPRIKQAKKGNGPMRLASAPLSGKGLVLDYVAAASATNFTFAGNTNYYVSGTVNLTGTNTTFEGGVIFKYSPTNTPKLNISTPITWQGSIYRPIVMTARDDNSVGETITGSTGNPNTNYFANPALYIDGTAAGTNATLQNLRIAYAQSAIVFNGKTGHVVSHAQLLNCANGITATNAEFRLRNALLYKVLTNFNGSSVTGRCEHLTVNTASWMNKSSAITLIMTNSLLLYVTNAGTFTSNYVATVTASAFQTVGAANHYLAVSSTNRNAGTTNINASLTADLKKLTTYPPLEWTNDFTTATTLSPQAQRDTDIPDVGYHYDPLDYVVSGRTLTNSTLTLTNGVALGVYGSSSTFGIYIRNGGNLVSEGTPTTLNQIVRYNASQEQANTNWSASTVAPNVKSSYDGTVRPTGSFRFTRWSLPGGTGYHFNAEYVGVVVPYGFKDCQFGPGTFGAIQCAVAMTNCLLERPNLNLDDDGGNYGYYGFNNLFRAGRVTLNRNGSTTWLFKDNLFDQSTISATASITHGNNGYVTNANRITPNQATDKILTNAPIYQTSYLGKYYYPTNGGLLSLLIDAGSRNATNATLYHYTTTTNQVNEGNSTVDIGFHYVAVNSSGNPIDSDGDGLADYLEDKNGNGVYDAGDLANWISSDLDTDGDGVSNGIELFQGRNPNSPTLPGSVNDTNNLTGLRVYTPLK